MADKLNVVKHTIKQKVQSLMPWTEARSTEFESWLAEYREEVRKDTGLNLLVQLGHRNGNFVFLSVSVYRGEVVDACLDCLLC